MKMSWDLDVTHIGLIFFTVPSPGFGNSNEGSILERAHDPRKALIETAILASSIAYLTKNWWPLIGPFAYILTDQVWHGTREIEFKEVPPMMDGE